MAEMEDVFDIILTVIAFISGVAATVFAVVAFALLLSHQDYGNITVYAVLAGAICLASLWVRNQLRE
jgi:undecaprenyl pyrophosphate phosphatase UppP